MSKQVGIVLDLLIANAIFSFKDILLLDIAVSSSLTLRTGWCKQVRLCISKVADRLNLRHSTIKWMLKRDIPLTRLLADCRSEEFRVTIDRRREEEKAFNFLLERNPLLSSGVLLTLLAFNDPSINYGSGESPTISPVAKGLQNRLSNMLKVDHVSDLTFVNFDLKTVREISLSGCQGITDIGLNLLSKGCHNLQTINLSDCMGITINGLKALGVECEQVQSIDLSCCRDITNFDKWICEGYKKLKMIDISGLEIEDSCLRTLTKKCVLLETISMDSSRLITDTGLNYLVGMGNDVIDLTVTRSGDAYGCKHLQAISLRDCERISDIGLSALASGCKLLKAINLSGCQGITDIGISALGAGCGQLQKIELIECEGITDIGLSSLGAGCGQLQTINLSRCEGITDIGISALGAGCGQLQTIDLSECEGITDIGLSALGAGCGQLQTINLSRCEGITDIGISALGAGCGHLQTIDLSECEGITDIGLLALSHGCNRLQTINISHCQGITEKGISALTGCAEIEVIRLIH